MRSIASTVLAAAMLHGCAFNPEAGPSAPVSDLAHALVAAAPAAGRAEQMRLYGRFIGAWDLDVTVYPDDGPPVHAAGEWIFGWVLEGRAIQDTWIVPARPGRDPGAASPGPYGTTLRFPVPGRDGWRIVWINPVNGALNVMSAREVDGEIVQDGQDEDMQPFRWVFHDITPERFRWRAESLAREGHWRLNQEMVVTRRH